MPVDVISIASYIQQHLMPWNPNALWFSELVAEKVKVEHSLKSIFLVVIVVWSFFEWRTNLYNIINWQKWVYDKLSYAGHFTTRLLKK